ncbi:MAG: hypothetical protein WKF84_02425 [Pyrinomonadaceae bacterium]
MKSLDARFDAGRLSASGTVDTATQAFNLKATGNDVQLSIVQALAGGAAAAAAGGALPSLSGAVDLKRERGRAPD